MSERSEKDEFEDYTAADFKKFIAIQRNNIADLTAINEDLQMKNRKQALEV